MRNLTDLTASEASVLIARGELTSLELVDACLNRIADRDPALKAWAHVDPEGARARARLLDGSASLGPLHGIPVGVKDIIDTVDMPTAYGSRLYTGHRPAWDAACVAALHAAGAVVLGKTATSEFAGYSPAPTRNPHDLSRTPGISSMGSAAAVADRMVPLALGTQTGASIIRPAALCGAIGYKPTFGLFNRAGVRPFADSLDTLGAIARSIEDIRMLGLALNGERARRTGIDASRPVRLGFCRTPAWKDAQASIRDSFEIAARRAREHDFDVREVSLPDAFADLDAATVTIMRYEGARALAYERNKGHRLISPLTLEFLKRATEVGSDSYRAARRLVERCGSGIAAIFEDVDVIATPAAECEAGPAEDAAGNSVFNRFWTALHLPCVTLPLSAGATGLPIGLQLVGPRDGDDRLLSIAGTVLQRLSPAGQAGITESGAGADPTETS